MAGLNGCARSLISQVSRRTAVRGLLARRSLPIITTTRNDGIFTKYREPPNGFLFNEKPLKPGEKRVWEDWEAIWYVGWGVSVLIVALAFMFKPDTSPVAAAREEAMKRIEEYDAALAENSEDE
eukprot:Seg2619.4 transcript_id=Seg2619.4/GoldUCD/mRNA.D3Y31 product="hypothetical protein" protein_id=Seg2619.4/GoldUCD/D3Y31